MMMMVTALLGAGLLLVAEPAASIHPDQMQPIPLEPSGTLDGSDIVVLGAIPSFAYGSGVMHFAVKGDFDGDGDVDAAAYQRTVTYNSYAPDQVTILLNQSDGSFAVSKEYPSALSPAYSPLPHMQDFDGDGDIDLLVRAPATGLIGFLPNMGSAQFDENTPVWSAVAVAQMEWWDLITAGDIDEDGDIDLVRCEKQQANGQFELRVLINDGSGVFEAGEVVAVNLTLQDSVLLHDINDDGLLDVVWTIRAVGWTSVAYGREGPTFEPPLIVDNTFPGEDRYPVFADLNGDGITDMAYAFRRRDPGIAVLIGNGTSVGFGDYSAPPSQAHDAARTDLMQPLDLDADGDTDFLWSPFGGSRLVGKLINDGSGNFHRGELVNVASGARQQLLIDADNDGDLDVLALGNNSYSVVINGGDGDFEGPVVIPLSSVGTEVAAVDLDQDGNAEVVSAGATIDILPIVAGELANPVRAYPGFDSLASMTFADLDADGDPDFIAVDAQSGMLTTRFNDGNGEFSETVSYATLGQPSDVITADIDGDGDSDVVVSHVDSDPSVFVNNAVGALSSPQPLNVAARDNIRILDMNGDELLDVFTTRPDVTLYLNNPQSPGDYTPIYFPFYDINPNSIALGDADDDGDTDIVWNRISPDPKIGLSEVIVSLNDGGGAFTSGSTVWSRDTGYPVDVIAVRDLDGDGDTDILLGDMPFLYYMLKEGSGQSYTVRSVTNATLWESRSLLTIPGNDLVDVVTLDSVLSTKSVSLLSVSLSSACPADLTGEGTLNFFDVSAFIDAFNAHDPVADFHPDGVFNFFDISDYLAAFSSGCP